MASTGRRRRPFDDLARAIVKPERTRPVLNDASTPAGTESGSQADAWSNPMTSTGDLIDGAESGSPERVGVGTAGQVLTVVDIGAGDLRPRWAAPTAAGTGRYREYAYVPDGSGGIDLIDAGDGTAVYTLEDLE